MEQEQEQAGDKHFVGMVSGKGSGRDCGHSLRECHLGESPLHVVLEGEGLLPPVPLLSLANSFVLDVALLHGVSISMVFTYAPKTLSVWTREGLSILSQLHTAKPRERCRCLPEEPRQ